MQLIIFLLREALRTRTLWCNWTKPWQIFLISLKKIGLKHTLIVLAANHGMADIPEYLTERGYEAGRLDPDKIVVAANIVGKRFDIDD